MTITTTIMLTKTIAFKDLQLRQGALEGVVSELIEPVSDVKERTGCIAMPRAQKRINDRFENQRDANTDLFRYKSSPSR